MIINSDVIVHQIFHISDIHIRLYQRMKEYQFCFDELYKTLLSKTHQDKNNIIVITGDIVHSKNELSPECDTKTFDFLSTLASIFPTFLIAGNHDALLNNRNRMDTLSSILHQRNTKNLYFLKNTNVYQYGNVYFHVDSLLDDQTIDMTIRPKEVGIHIALFHGSIQGWKNAKGYTSDSGEKYMEEFTGMDYVLLGDIHMFQYMSKTKPVAAYASSLVSQNFGETDLDHGVLIWDLVNKTQTFERIENPYRYQDVHVVNENDVCTDGLQSSLYDVKIAKWGQIRVYANDDEIGSKKVFFQLQQSFPEANFHFQFKKSLKDIDDDDRTSESPTPSLSDDVVSLREYIKDHVPSQYRKEMYEYVLDRWHHQEMFSIPIHWDILSISFSNLFGYGESNSISFSDCRSKNIIGIFGNNSVGKSTIVDIISLLLFDKVTRLSHGQSIPKEVIHVEEKEAYGQIVLRIGSEKYIIEKQYKRQKNEKIKQVTKFFQISSVNEKLELTGEQRKRTNQFIEQIVGKYDTFIYINSYLQQREQSFRDMTSSLKKKFMNDLYGYNWFSQLEKETKEFVKELKVEYRIKEDDYKSLLSQSFSLSSSMEQVNLLQDEINFERNEIERIQKRKDHLLLKIKWTDESYQDRKSVLLENLDSIENSCKIISESLSEAALYISKWKNHTIVQQHDNVENSLFFQQWHPTVAEKKDWTLFHKNISEYKTSNVQSEILKNRSLLVEKLKNYESADIEVDESILKWYLEKDWNVTESKLVFARENEKMEEALLKQLYTSLRISFENLTDPSFYTVEENRMKTEQSLLEQEMESIQNELKQFQDILPFVQKENTSLFLKNHHKWKSNSFYQKFSPFFCGKQSEWKIEYKEYECAKKDDTDMIQQEIEELEEKLERFHHNKANLPCGSRLSSSMYRVFEKRLQKYVEPMRNLLEAWTETEDSNLVQLQKLENALFLTCSEIDMLQTSIHTLTFVPNPKCEICLNNQDYKQKLLRKKEIQTKQKKKVKIEQSILQIKKLFAAKFPSIFASSGFSGDIVSEKLSHEKLYKQNRKQLEDYEEARIGFQKHDEYKVYQQVTDEISKLKMKLKVKKEKFAKLYSFLKQSHLYEYVSLQWAYIGIFPENFEKLETLINNHTTNFTQMEQNLKMVQSKIITGEDRWKVFQNEFYNDLKVYKRIKETEDNVTERKKMEIWFAEVLKLKKKKVQDAEYAIIKELENKQENLELLQNNLPTIHYLSVLWELPDLWNLDIPNVKEKLSFYENQSIVWENEKHIKISQKILLEKQLEEIEEEWENHQTVYQELKELEMDNERHHKLLVELDKQQIAEKLKHQTNKDSQIACKEMEKKLYHLEEEIKKKEILNSILEKDGLPLYLLNKKMKIMECQMNDLLSPFLPGKQIRFFIEQKSIEFGVISSSNSNTMVNLFGGMESFILELVIKLTFSKYSILPRSNFFIIDEGISVLDQQNISNINSLFQFLSHLVTNVLLISHIPQIQDFVDKSMYITKTNNKSNVVFGKK